MSLVFICKPDNDLYRTLVANGEKYLRHETARQAVEEAPPGAGVLLLADGYPQKTTLVDLPVFEIAAAKSLRVYIEYPSMLPGLKLGEPRTHRKGEYGSNLDRVVVTSDAFGAALQRMRILMVHDNHFLPVNAHDTHLVVARVAGYDTAVFGLPAEEVWPVLFELPQRDFLVATTKLSHFITGRYAPTAAWGEVWRMILGWLQPGKPVPHLKWRPTVRPSYGRADRMPQVGEFEALRRGVRWFGASGLFIDPSGKEGFYEGFGSKEMRLNGSQGVSKQVRADCHGEVSMSLALGGEVLGDASLKEVAANLGDLIYHRSPSAKGPRLDPESPSYGLIGGDMKPGQSDVPFDLVTVSGSEELDGAGVYYGDDFARHVLGSAAAAAILGTDRWDGRMVMEILANFRTTGPWGFRSARLEEPDVQKNGWRYYWERSEGCWTWNGGNRRIPHYQAYPWAVYLWLYGKTRFDPLLERTLRGIREMMEAYPDGWGSEANRHETERCRMLLPLAWLVRVDDRPEHRQWLSQIKEYVLGAQDVSGAIQQRIVREMTSNEQYGTGECSLIHANGDPATDLLYATNFAFIGLHEAAAATGDRELVQAEDRLADFLVRAQTRSESHPELDGAWYRGFDFEKWDYWGSDGDLGWGVWAIETGWTVGWITATLALRHMKTSLWDLSADSNIAKHFDKHRKQMLPDEVLEVAKP